MISKYNKLSDKSLNTGTIDPDDIKWIIDDNNVELLPLLYAAYKVRIKYRGKKVKIHVINNIQSGGCTEDCKYCAQSKKIKDSKNIYPMKSEEDILKEAENAYKMGAYRYCMVLSGRDIGKNRIEVISEIVKKIKENYKIEVCVSAGFLTEKDAAILKSSGVNRYNHSINTSERYYKSICSSHDYSKRIDTINNAKKAGLDVCSGIIIGIGETTEDLISIINEFKKIQVKSIPVNFFLPVDGHTIKNPQKLTPEYCLKILALFRLAVPKAEIRAAGGREYHMRSLQPLCLYAADSLFSKGYLTTDGESIDETKQMIIDCGFELDKIEY